MRGCLFGVPGADGAGGGGVVDEALHQRRGVGGAGQGEAPHGVLEREVGQGGVVQSMQHGQDAVLGVQPFAAG